MVSAQIIPPSPILQDFVHHYWILKTSGIRMSDVIMPKGCLKWIFHKKKPFNVCQKPDTSIAASVCGPYEKAIRIESNEDVEMLTVFFQPYAARFIMGSPCQEFANNNIDFYDMENRAFKELEEKVLCTASDAKCIETIEAFILQQLAKVREFPYLQPLMEVFRQIKHTPEARVDTLANTACLSERQFRRVFMENVGISPKQTLRIQRLLSAAEALMSPDFASFTDLLYQFGYTDHSHFNKDFQLVAGMSPTAYVRFLEEEKHRGYMTAYRSYHSP